MEVAQLIAEVLKYLLPAAAVLIAVKLMLNANRNREMAKENAAIRGQALSKIIPLRLQAYERAILFLERISPENLLGRTEVRGRTSKDLWMELQETIRSEYEHNLAQQLYMNPESWAALVRAKENVLTLVNQCGKSLPPQAPALDLGKRILEVYKQTESSPAHEAIATLKTEAQKSLRLNV